MTFERAFSWMKIMVFWFHFYLNFLPKFHLIVGHQCNGLEPDSRETITRTNDDPRLWHHMGSLSHNELGIAIIREKCYTFVIVAVYKSCNIIYIYICNVNCWDFRVYHISIYHAMHQCSLAIVSMTLWCHFHRLHILYARISFPW